MEQGLKINGDENQAVAIACRTGLGVGALVLATSVPNFALFMALMGSFLTLAVSVIFPSACYLSIFEDQVPVVRCFLAHAVYIPLAVVPRLHAGFNSNDPNKLKSVVLRPMV